MYPQTIQKYPGASKSCNLFLSLSVRLHSATCYFWDYFCVLLLYLKLKYRIGRLLNRDGEQQLICI